MFFHDLTHYFKPLMSGLGLTMLLTVISLAISTVLAVGVAEARMSRNPLIRLPARVYIDIIRGTPLLLQLFFAYYALPQIGLTISAFEAGVLALALNYGAYLAETFRGCIEGVPEGQSRGGFALGLKPWQIKLYVIYPQALRIAFPTYVGMTLSLIKDTSLVAIVTLEELFFRGELIVSQNFQPLEIYAIVGLIYLAVSYIVSFAASLVERKLRAFDNRSAGRPRMRRAGRASLGGARV